MLLGAFRFCFVQNQDFVHPRQVFYHGEILSLVDILKTILMSLYYLFSQTSYTLFLEQVIVIKGQSSLPFRCLRHCPNVGTCLLKLYARLRIQLRGRHLKLRVHGGTSCQTSPVCPVVWCLVVATTLGTGSWKHIYMAND